MIITDTLHTIMDDIMTHISMVITHIITHTNLREELKMYYRYHPYPFYMRHYNVTPYNYRRYYNPYYNYQQNIFDSQIADVNQSIVNYGDMNDVIQNSDIYQSMTPEPENIVICTSPPDEPPNVESIVVPM